jgi:cell division protein FtsW (lipid II flippase)
MRRDMIFGGITLAFSVIYYRVADTIPTSQLADAIGPQGLPKIYAVVLAALSLILMIGSVRPAGQSPIPNPQSPIFRVAGMLLIGVAYILLAPWLGYPLAIAGVILATTYYQGGTLTRSVALVSLCGGVFFWLLFVVMMGIEQPAGWWN